MKKELWKKICAGASAAAIMLSAFGAVPVFATGVSADNVIDIIPLVDFNDWANETVAKNTQYSGNGKPTGEVFYAMNNPGTVTMKARGAGDKYLVNAIGEFAYMKDHNASTLGKAAALDKGEQMVFSFETFSGTGNNGSVNIRMGNDQGPTNLFNISNNTLKLYDGVADVSSIGLAGSVIGQVSMPKNQWVNIDLVYTRLGTTLNGSECDGLEVYINGKKVKPECVGNVEFSGKVVPMKDSVLDGAATRFTFIRGIFDNVCAKHYTNGMTYVYGGKVVTSVVPLINFDNYETAEIPVEKGDSAATADIAQWSVMQPIFSVQNDCNLTGTIYATIETKDGSTTDKYFGGVYNKYDGGTSTGVEFKYTAARNGNMNFIALSEGEKLEYGISVHSGKSFYIYDRTGGDDDTGGILDYLFRVQNGKLYVFDGNTNTSDVNKAMGYVTLPSNQWVDIRVVYTGGDGIDNNIGSGADDTVEVYIGAELQNLTANNTYSGNGRISADGINKLAVDFLDSSSSRLSFGPTSVFDNFSVIKYAEAEEVVAEENPSILGIDHQPNDFTYFHSERVMLSSKDYEFAGLMATSGNSYVIEPSDKKNQYKGDKLIMTRGSGTSDEGSLVMLGVPTYGVTTDLIPYDKKFDYFLIEGLFHITSTDLGGILVSLSDDISSEIVNEDVVTLKNGKIAAGGGEKQISTDTWHHLKMIVNIADGYYDVVLDGELLCQNIEINDVQVLTSMYTTINQGTGSLEIREMEVTGLSKEPSLTQSGGVYDFDIEHTSQFIDDNLTRNYLSDKLVFHGDGDMTYNRGTKTEYDKDSFVYDDEERELYVPLSVINDQLDADVEYKDNQWVKGNTVLAEGPAAEAGEVIMPMIDFDDWQNETVAKNTKYSGNGQPENQVFYAMNNPGAVKALNRKTGDKCLSNGIGEFTYRSNENPDSFNKIAALDKGEQLVISFETHPSIGNGGSTNIRANNDKGPTTLFAVGSGKLHIFDGIPEYIKEGVSITKGTVIGEYTLPSNRWTEVDLVYTRFGTEKDGVPCDSVEVYIDGKLAKPTATTDMPINGMVVPMAESVLDSSSVGRFTFTKGAYDNLGIKLYKDGEVFSTDEEENKHVYKGESLAPVKAIAKALGYTCEYYKYGKMVMIAEKGAELPVSNDDDARPWFDEQYYSTGWCIHGQTYLSDVQEIGNFIFYDRPTAEQLKATYNSKAQSHPRIVMTPDKVSLIKERITADAESNAYSGVYTNAINKIEATARKTLEDGYVATYEFDTDDEYRTLAHAKEFENRAINLGMAYLLTSDEELKADCADYVIRNLKIISTFPDFNYGHVIDAGVWLYGTSIAFDWFYDEFESEEERAEVAEGLLDIGIRPMNRTFYAMLPSALGKDSPGPGNMGNANNYVKWKSNFVPYTQHGLVTASLVLADYDADVCFDTIEKSIRNWEYSNLGLYPEGGWLEGKGYLSVVHNNTAAAFASLLNVMGDEYNVLEATGVEESLDKVIQLTSQTGSFAFADEGGQGGSMSGVPSSASFYADYYGREDLERMRQWRYRYGDAGAWSWTDLIFYNHIENQDHVYKGHSYSVMDTINYTEGTEIVTVHEDWAAGESLFFALAGGPTRHYHFHNDGGDFNLCMDGQRWSYEMGTGNYNIGNNYTKYAGRAEGHNTLVINPGDDPAYKYGSGYGGYKWTAQKEQSMATIMDYGEIDGGAYATLDMSQLYEDAGAQRVHRGAWIDENYNVVTLRDEIEFAEDEEFDGYWFMHTKGDYEQLNANTIRLRMLSNVNKDSYVESKIKSETTTAQNNGTPLTEAEIAERRAYWQEYFDENAKTLYVQVQVDGADSYEVKMMPAEPLPTSPVLSNDPTNTNGINKIAVYYQGSGEIDITVRMSNAMGETIDTTPISQWLISDLYKEGDDIKLNLVGDYDDEYQLFVAEYKDKEFVAVNTGEAVYDAARGHYKCTVTPITDDADECVLYLWNKNSYAPLRKLVRIRMSDLAIIE